MATINIAQVLEDAGANRDAPEGSQGWALAQIANIVAAAETGLATLGSELSAMARQQDADEIRRRAGWAAADVDTLRGMFQNAQANSCADEQAPREYASTLLTRIFGDSESDALPTNAEPALH